jgi:hypothetical protein
MQPRERRKFSRIPFDGEVSLFCDSKVFTTELIDISLNGVLLKRPEHWSPDSDQTMQVAIHGFGDSFVINMQTRIEHVDGHLLGLQCIEIDIDSATTLRRLVELNLGDTALLNRELTELAGSTHLRDPE